MKSVLVLAVLFGVVFALTQGSPLKAQLTKSLKKCDEKKIDKYIDKIIDDTYDLKEEAYEAYENAYSGMLKCVVSSFTDIVDCVEGVVEDNLGDFEEDLEKYMSNVQTLAKKVVAMVEECA